MPNKVVDRDSSLLVLIEHRLYDTPKFVAEVLGNAIEVTLFYFQGESQLILCFERRSQSGHLVGETTKRPDVTLLIILLLVDLLGAHVVGRSDVGLGVHRTIIQDSGQSKVSQLCILANVKEDVSWF